MAKATADDCYLDLLIFLQFGVEKLLSRTEIKPTTLDLNSESGAHEQFAIATLSKLLVDSIPLLHSDGPGSKIFDKGGVRSAIYGLGLNLENFS